MAMRTGRLLQRKLGVERLERRDLLAGFSATLDSQGVLKIVGTEAADQMYLQNDGSKLWIYGQAQKFDVASVKQIQIDALGGDDMIRLDSQVFGGNRATTISTIINAGAGNDYVLAAEGRDVVYGGDGNDLVFGVGGNDYIDGGLGFDVLLGGNGNDYVAGDKGGDLILGEAGDDTLLGGDGIDALYGGDGNDWLDGGRDYDWVLGDAGNDSLFETGTNYIYDLTSQQFTSHIGWFDQNISDDLLRSIARSAYSDGSLNRTDMIAIFGAVSRDGVVTTTELSSVRSIVVTGSGLQMDEHVRVLANKVVNSDTGNARFQGVALGNLVAGNTGTQLNNLVGKWFLGVDRPNTTVGSVTYNYAYAQGNLFVNGAAFNDLKQGYLGDCYFLVGLGAASLRSPASIQQMFIDNGDGTYTVRFFNNGKADYVTVDRYLPVDGLGRFVFANVGQRASLLTNELWIALAEKAYAQMNASGWLRGPSGVNSYSSIAAGYTGDAFKQITGREATIGNAINFNSIVNAFNSGALIGLSTNSSGPVAAGVVRSHGYVMTGYNTVNQTVTLFNPWGENNGSVPATLTLTIAQVQGSFSYFDRTF